MFSPLTGNAYLIVNPFYSGLVRKPRLGRLTTTRVLLQLGIEVEVYNLSLYRRRWLHHELVPAIFKLFSEDAAVASAMELLPVCSCRVR